MEECGCTLSSEELAKRREQVKTEIMIQVTKVVELDDGFELVWARKDDSAECVEQEVQLQDKVLQWIRQERKCCSFLSFELLFPVELGPFSLRIRGGGPVVKRSLKNELAPIIAKTASLP